MINQGENRRGQDTVEEYEMRRRPHCVSLRPEAKMRRRDHDKGVYVASVVPLPLNRQGRDRHYEPGQSVCTSNRVFHRRRYPRRWPLCGARRDGLAEERTSPIDQVSRHRR